jgi:proteic killer suppression protein
MGNVVDNVALKRPPMIASFNHKGLRDFWMTDSKKGIPAFFALRIEIMLDALDTASDIAQLNVSGFRLHQLKGDRKGEWSIWVSGNWRITFKFSDGNVYDLNLEDYH